LGVLVFLCWSPLWHNLDYPKGQNAQLFSPSPPSIGFIFCLLLHFTTQLQNGPSGLLFAYFLLLCFWCPKKTLVPSRNFPHINHTPLHCIKNTSKVQAKNYGREKERECDNGDQKSSICLLSLSLPNFSFLQIRWILQILSS
jgi:hypothetical protein